MSTALSVLYHYQVCYLNVIVADTVIANGRYETSGLQGGVSCHLVALHPFCWFSNNTHGHIVCVYIAVHNCADIVNMPADTRTRTHTHARTHAHTRTHTHTHTHTLQ